MGEGQCGAEDGCIKRKGQFARRGTRSADQKKVPASSAPRGRAWVVGFWVSLAPARCRPSQRWCPTQRNGCLGRSAARGLPDHVFKGRHPPTISRPRRLRRATVPCKGGSRAWTLGRADDCGTEWAVGGGQWAVRNYCKLPPHGTLFSYRGTNSAAEARTARRCALHVP